MTRRAGGHVPMAVGTDVPPLPPRRGAGGLVLLVVGVLVLVVLAGVAAMGTPV